MKIKAITCKGKTEPAVDLTRKEYLSIKKKDTEGIKKVIEEAWLSGFDEGKEQLFNDIYVALLGVKGIGSKRHTEIMYKIREKLNVL